MSRTHHIDTDAIEELIDRPRGDVEAEAARAHCAACETCQAAWERATRSLLMLDDGFALDLAPPSDLVARGLALIAEDERATTGEASVAAAPPKGTAPPKRTGWPWQALAAACATLAAVALAWLGLGPTEIAQPALKCASIELGAAGLVWLTTARVLYRRGGLSGGTGAVSASVGGLSGALYLHLACSDHHAGHLFLAHALTVGIAAIGGAFAARSFGPRLRAAA